MFDRRCAGEQVDVRFSVNEVAFLTPACSVVLFSALLLHALM